MQCHAERELGGERVVVRRQKLYPVEAARAFRLSHVRRKG